DDRPGHAEPVSEAAEVELGDEQSQHRERQPEFPHPLHRRSAVIIAKRIASPSGPPDAKEKRPPDSTGAPTRETVASSRASSAASPWIRAPETAKPEALAPRPKTTGPLSTSAGPRI